MEFLNINISDMYISINISEINITESFYLINPESPFYKWLQYRFQILLVAFWMYLFGLNAKLGLYKVF